jgi:hypothetical protein
MGELIFFACWLTVNIPVLSQNLSLFLNKFDTTFIFNFSSYEPLYLYI